MTGCATPRRSGAAAAAGAEALRPRGGTGARALLARRRASELERRRPSTRRWRALAERLAALRYRSRGHRRRAARRTWRRGREDAGPERLEQVEERLAALARLERKHGGSDRRGAGPRRALPGVARLSSAGPTSRWRRSARARWGGAARVDGAGRERAARRRRPRRAGRRTSASGWPSWRWPRRGFEVALRPREDGCGPGARTVEFVIAPNPGLPTWRRCVKSRRAASSPA